MTATPETTVFLARHGQTDQNQHRVVQGHTVDARLNQAGQVEAERLAARLADVPLDALYSSPLRRASETAIIVGRYHPNTPVRTLEAFMEMGWGELEGQPFGPPNDRLFARFDEAWSRGEFDGRVPGGESLAEVLSRARSGLEHIEQLHRGGTIAVITHGRLLRVLLSSILPGYSLQRMDDLLHANAALTRLRSSDGRYTADILKDTSHLAPPPRDGVRLH